MGDNLDNFDFLLLQFGSYFGAALCAADLNGDNLDDLLVGAPMYMEKYDEGRVYVYINKEFVSHLMPEKACLFFVVHFIVLLGAFPLGKLGPSSPLGNLAETEWCYSASVGISEVLLHTIYFVFRM